MTFLSWSITVTGLVMACAAAAHALLGKRDPRSALGWIGVSVLFPFAGPTLYFLFGINRVRTRARKLERGRTARLSAGDATDGGLPRPACRVPDEYAKLARISLAVTGAPLVAGNHIELLRDGEEAYPSMLAAIESARYRAWLTTYLFESDETGRHFIDALSRARGRGVDVRVLLDGVGELYSFPRAGRALRRENVPIARYLPPTLVPPSIHINLRNHRKILSVDGEVAFTGGMNIGDRHRVQLEPTASRVTDLHFRVRGPVVEQIDRVFLDDWSFSTGGAPEAVAPFVGPDDGPALCRTIVDGPNEDIDRLPMIIVGAISAASTRVTVMTPYFLPPHELISALQAAALRGVEVSVILPGRNNLPFVHWATRNLLRELLERGVRVYYQPPPFAHSKLFIVDDRYAMIGSANLDPRSLRLNFEMMLEVYDHGFAERLALHCSRVLELSREVTIEEIDRRPLPERLRDALAWLFTPYL